MLKMNEIPNDFTMSPGLRTQAEWLYTNKEFSPGETMPFNLSDTEKTDHLYECKIYKENLLKFNEMLEGELDARQKENSDVVQRMRERDASVGLFRDALLRVVDTEHSRIISLLDESMLNHPLFIEWKQQLHQRLYTQIVGI